MGSEQNLEVPILKLSPSSCLLLLSLSPGVVQHPCVPPVSPWNNNTLSGLLYPYLCRKSLCRELLLAGKVSAQFSRWDHWVTPWLCWDPRLPFWRTAKNWALSIVSVQIGQIIILLDILMKREEVKYTIENPCSWAFPQQKELRELYFWNVLNILSALSSCSKCYFPKARELRGATNYKQKGFKLIC